jgi:L-threonylcarbamoyladenylate synthase
VIAYPTEAVYGLGCDPGNKAAVQRILSLKKRGPEAGLILIADRFERFLPYILMPHPEIAKPALDSWPGPITWLFPRAVHVPDWLAGQHPTIAVRVSAHPICAALCEQFEGAVVSTSANFHSGLPATQISQLHDYFGDRIDGIVEGELGGSTNPSEIRDLLSGKVIRAV